MTLLEEQEEKPNLESPALNCGMETSIRAERQAVGVEPLAGSSPAPTTEECPVCSADIFAAPAAVLDPCGHFFHATCVAKFDTCPTCSLPYKHFNMVE